MLSFSTPVFLPPPPSCERWALAGSVVCAGNVSLRVFCLHAGHRREGACVLYENRTDNPLMLKRVKCFTTKCFLAASHGINMKPGPWWNARRTQFSTRWSYNQVSSVKLSRSFPGHRSNSLKTRSRFFSTCFVSMCHLKTKNKKHESISNLNCENGSAVKMKFLFKLVKWNDSRFFFDK